MSGGQQGTKNIRVIPSYAGNWSGSYTVTGCTQSGAFAEFEFCDSFSTGRVMRYGLSLAQAGDAVSGKTYLGDLEFGQASATVTGSGDVVLSSTYREDTLTVTAVWTLSSPAQGRLSGTIRHTWRDSVEAGEMVVAGTISDSTKTASLADGGDAG